MSDKDRPRNPFGRGERTIIRPNPGGRLPAAPSGNPQPNPTLGRLLPHAVTAPQTTPESPAQVVPLAVRGAPTTPAAEEWIQSAAPPPAPAVSADRPGPALRVDDLVAPNANPIMRAAGPLLQLLGRLRVALLRASFANLMEQVAESIKFFEKDIRSAGVSEQQANNAKYILCATADDIVQHIPTEERHVWAQYSMLSRFFGERIGGVRFFEMLNQAKLDPLINYPVLGIVPRLLGAWFPGCLPHPKRRLGYSPANPAGSV